MVHSAGVHVQGWLWKHGHNAKGSHLSMNQVHVFVQCHGSPGMPHPVMQLYPLVPSYVHKANMIEVDKCVYITHRVWLLTSQNAGVG